MIRTPVERLAQMSPWPLADAVIADAAIAGVLTLLSATNVRM